MTSEHAGRWTAGTQRRRWFTVVALLLLVGIAWMHTLGAAPLPPGMRPAVVMTAVSSVAAEMSGGMAEHDGCGAAGHSSCPDPGHHDGHAGSMCQAPALGGAVFAAPQLLAVGAPVPRVTVLLVTAAIEAAGGTGCGPPSLAMLSISRT